MYLSGMFNAVDTQTSSLCHATVHKKRFINLEPPYFWPFFV